MAKIEKFEDIEAWKKAREVAKEIYAISNEGLFARDFGLRDQIRRAAVSVMSNIAEGFERGGDVEFRRFLAIAKGSAGEVKAQTVCGARCRHDRPSHIRFPLQEGSRNRKPRRGLHEISDQGA